eukprot:1700050-Prymnesium_polylepis.1
MNGSHAKMPGLTGHAGGLAGGPRMPQAGMRYAPNGHPMAMPASSMGGYGPPSGGKGGPGNYGGSSYNGAPTGYGSYGAPGMNGGYGGEYSGRDGGYGYGMQ